MKVLYLCPTYDYGDPSRGVSSFEMLNLGEGIKNHPLVSKFRHFDYIDAMQKYGHAKMTEMVVERAKHFDVVWHNTWHEELDAAITDIPCATVGFGFDDDWRGDYARRQATLHDFWVTTSKTFDAPDVLHTQYAVYPPSYPNLGLVRDIDISFVGQPHGKRAEYIKALQGAGIQVECYGFGWPNGEIPHKQMVEVFNRSKIVLNFSECSDRMHLQIKARTFEAPACGALLLTDYAPGLEDYYAPDEEAYFFVDAEDAIEGVRWLLAHELDRADAARRGYERTMRDHTWAKRLDDILPRLGG